LPVSRKKRGSMPEIATRNYEYQKGGTRSRIPRVGEKKGIQGESLTDRGGFCICNVRKAANVYIEEESQGMMMIKTSGDESTE